MESRRRPRLDPNLDLMPKTLFIDTNKLPRVKTPQGEATEILNEKLAGAKNVRSRPGTAETSLGNSFSWKI